MMFCPSQFAGTMGNRKVANEKVKPVLDPPRRSFASVVAMEGSRRQGLESMGR